MPWKPLRWRLGNWRLKHSRTSFHSWLRSTRWYQIKYISSSSYLGRGGRRRSPVSKPVDAVVAVEEVEALEATEEVVGAVRLELLETES